LAVGGHWKIRMQNAKCRMQNEEGQPCSFCISSVSDHVVDP
jgi:hypothetical protein